MMLGPTALIVAALAAGPAQAGGARAPQTDETVPAVRGARLIVDNFAGEVAIKVWERDSVRVQARHSRGVKVNIRTTPAGIVVRADDQARGSVDYEITAPSWMPLKVTGTFNFIIVEGSQSEVSADTTRGDVVIKGGSGAVTAKSVEGEVIIEGARGRVTASSVNEGITITGASGDITAETTNGDITLTQIKSQIVEVDTINGDIGFDGTPADRGRYQFTTHNGDITVAVPESANVSFNIRTYQGSFSSAVTLSGPPRSEVRKGRRTTYVSGNGSAEMEVESFGGSIRIVPPGGLKAKGRGKERD
jgi:DUF4097 and DUF4098 domain-containing protein YvlB